MARGEWGALGGSQPAVFLLLLLMSQWGHGQIQSLRQKRQQPSNMPMITGLDVTCEKSGMTVNLQFSAPFNGVVFSKGHFSNPACSSLIKDLTKCAFSSRSLIPGPWHPNHLHLLCNPNEWLWHSAV